MSPLFYRDEHHGKTQPHVMTFAFKVTSAGLEPVTPGLGVYGFLAAQSPSTQAQIDAYLGAGQAGDTVLVGSTETPILSLVSGTSALGTNGIGGIVNMLGQVKSIVYVASTHVVDPSTSSAALDFYSNTAVAATGGFQVSKTKLGNIVFKLLPGTLLATGAIVKVDIGFIAK